VALILSSAELDQLSETLEVLVSPTSYASVLAWRDAACRAVQRLVRVDGVATTLHGTPGPVTHGTEFYTASAMASYAEFYDQRTEIDRLRLARRLPYWVRSEVVLPGEFEKTTYCQEWCRPNRILDSAGIAAAVPAAFGGDAVMHINSETAGTFGPEGRERALLQLLQPAFAAGVRGALLALSWKGEVERELDSLGVPLALCGPTGKLAHATPSLLEVVRSDPEGSRLLTCVSRLAGEVGALVRRCRKDQRSSAVAQPTRTCSTRAGDYVLRSTLVHSPELLGQAPLVLVMVDPPAGDKLPSIPALRARHGLTARESEVALLLAAGRRNRDIATALRVTEHTARRHTERVLQKLDVTSRAEVAATLRAGVRKPHRRPA
jgi:DNA-binding CsgD family transcriptional regulator